MPMPQLAPPGSVALYPSGSTGGEGQKEAFFSQRASPSQTCLLAGSPDAHVKDIT